MAKIAQVSTDGTTYYTLPGNNADFTDDANGINDTILGQDYKSNESGLINWSISSPAFYKGFAGYQATIKKAGTSTVFTAEAMSLVSGKTYKTTNAAKNCWDATAAVTIYDNAVAVNASNIASINYLFGQVTFIAGFTPTGAITATGKYLPLADVGTANSFTLKQSADTKETTDFATAKANGGYRTFALGLHTASLDLSGTYTVSNGFRGNLTARDLLIIQINPDGNDKSSARGYFKVSKEKQSGAVGALEEEATTFELNVPSSNYVPFDWKHASDTTLNTAVKICLDAWLNGTVIYTKYLHDGTNGVSGQAVVTDVSLSSGLDNMNEFSVSLQGTGATSNVGLG